MKLDRMQLQYGPNTRSATAFPISKLETIAGRWEDPATHKRPFIVHEDKQAVSKKPKHDATVDKGAIHGINCSLG